MKQAWWAAGLTALAVLTGCVGRDGPNPDVKVTDGNSARGALSDDAIRKALAGKTFQYTRPEGNGIVTYNADGTTEVVDDNKGNASGSWRADGGRLCESLNPSALAPNGREESCQTFTNTGDAYYAGKIRLSFSG